MCNLDAYKKMGIIWICFLFCGLSGLSSTKEMDITVPEEEPNQSLSSFGIDMLEFFSKDDPIGLPAVYIPEPINLHLEHNISYWYWTLNLWDLKIQGLDKLQLTYIFINFTDCTIHAEAKVSDVTLVGQYLFEGVFSYLASTGDMNLTFEDANLFLDGQVNLDHDGLLRTNRSQMKLEVNYDDLQLEMKDLGTAYEGVLELIVPNFLPLLIRKAEDWIHNTLSQSLRSPESIPQFPDSLHPIDFLFISKVQPLVRDLGFDSWKLETLWIDIGSGILLKCDDFQLKGLSTLHWKRGAEIIYIDNTFLLLLHVGTQSLKATGNCGVSYLSLFGTSLEIQVEETDVLVEVHLRSHLRSPPTLRSLHINLGNIEAKSSLFGSLGFVADALMNLAPNLLREKLQEQIENKIWTELQDRMNSLDVHDIIFGRTATTGKESVFGFKI